MQCRDSSIFASPSEYLACPDTGYFNLSSSQCFSNSDIEIMATNSKNFVKLFMDNYTLARVWRFIQCISRSPQYLLHKSVIRVKQAACNKHYSRPSVKPSRTCWSPMLFLWMQENIQRNFGMPQPNGYRKALRFMKHADHFGFPILTFVDTPGAYAGKSAEEQGQVILHLLAFINVERIWHSHNTTCKSSETWPCHCKSTAEQ